MSFPSTTTFENRPEHRSTSPARQTGRGFLPRNLRFGGKFLTLSPMDYSTILCATQDRLTVVTMNRPERRNALDGVMIKELTDAFSAANRNPQVRMVVLTCNGPAFCAGMDLEYLQTISALGQAENLEDARSLTKLLEFFRLSQCGDRL